MSDIVACVFREWSRRTGRTLSAVTGYVLAAGLMVVLAHLLFFSRDAKNVVLRNLGTHFLAYLPLNASGSASFARHVVSKNPGDEVFHSDPAQTMLFPLGKVREINDLPSVKSAAPFLMFRIKSTDDGHLFSVGGFEPGNTIALAGNSIQESDVIEGSFLRPGDRGVVILEEAYARSFDLKVGKMLVFGGMIFPIIGIVRPGVRPAKADVYMPFADAQRVINSRLESSIASESNIVMVEVESVRIQDQAKREVEAILPGCMIDSFNCYVPSARVMGMNEGAALVLMVLAMLGAVLFAFHSQLASVIERKHDIGILKSIGWTNEVIFRQIFAESFFQAILGGITGAVLGGIVILLVPLQEVSGIPGDVSLSPGIVIGAVALAVVGGVIAGIVPAVKAAWDSPADSLRRI